jgi:thiol-disulfide isomerase/thioredoxin
MRFRIALPVFLSCAAFVAFAGEPARPSPPLVIQQPGGLNMQLSQFHGKIVLLAFIHTTCPHCQELTGKLISVARDYEAKGVQVVECAFNMNAGLMVPAFTARFQPNFPVGWADNNTVMAYLGRSVTDPRPFYVPHLVFIDRQGMIQGDFAGESEFMRNPEVNIRAELDQMVKAPAPKPAATARTKSH